MEFGSSQVKVREDPDVSEEVRIEDETADVEKDLEPLGNMERSSSVRASSITRGSMEDGLDENVELDQDGGIKHQAVDSAADAANGDENAIPHWQKDEKQETSRPQVVVEEALPKDDINNPGSAAAKAQTTRLPADDQCCTFRCCGYPNGCFPIVFTQFFLLCGLLLCSWSMSDCKFIEATAGFPQLYYPPTTSVSTTEAPTDAPEPPPDTRRGFGFLFNETEQGGCGFEDESRYFVEDEIEYYFDFLGSDWDIPRYLSGASIVMGWILFFALITFACFSYLRSARWLFAALLILVIGGLQSSSFAVIGSSFCSDEATDCEPSRGFWMGVAGIGCYLIAAIMCCMMKDYPGAFA